jgi:hypothetical protein
MEYMSAAGSYDAAATGVAGRASATAEAIREKTRTAPRRRVAAKSTLQALLGFIGAPPGNEAWRFHALIEALCGPTILSTP